MKNAFRKLIPALIMVIVSALFVGTSTYAWFSMNKKVTVTGMSVKTQVSDSLAIADTNVSTGVVDIQYSNYLKETISGSLRPTSTTDGLNFWYTDPLNVLGNGDAIDDVYTKYSEAGVEQEGHDVDTVITNDANYLLREYETGKSYKTHYDEEFQKAFEVETPITATNVIYGYMDYTFYIKATNSKADGQNIVLEYCNLLYNGSLLGVEKAWRVAVFSQENVGRNTNYNGIGNRKAILTFADSANFSGAQAVKDETNLGSVSYNSSNSWSIATVGGKSTSYTKVTVRLWLEGEDTTCNNETFVTLTGDYTLDLAFAFGTDTAVEYLNSQLIVAEEGDENTNTITVKLYDQDRVSNMQFPRSYQWYDEDGNPVAGATDRTYTIPYDSDKEYYCVVTTDHGPYKTHTFLYRPELDTTSTANTIAVKLDGSDNLFYNGQTPTGYQWYKDGAVIAGEETETLTGFASSADDGEYYCVITTHEGDVDVQYKSETFTFTAPTATENALNLGKATVTVNNGETNATFKWYDSSDTEVGTGRTFVITDSNDNDDYYCEVTTTDGWVYVSDTVALEYTAPEVTNTATKATVTVTAGKLSNGETPIGYQWYKMEGATPAVAADTEVGTNNKAFEIEDVADNGTYYCVVTTSTGDYITDTVTLTVTP